MAICWGISKVSLHIEQSPQPNTAHVLRTARQLWKYSSKWQSCGRCAKKACNVTSHKLKPHETLPSRMIWKVATSRKSCLANPHRLPLGKINRNSMDRQDSTVAIPADPTVKTYQLPICKVHLKTWSEVWGRAFCFISFQPLRRSGVASGVRMMKSEVSGLRKWCGAYQNVLPVCWSSDWSERFLVVNDILRSLAICREHTTQKIE